MATIRESDDDKDNGQTTESEVVDTNEEPVLDVVEDTGDDQRLSNDEGTEQNDDDEGVTRERRPRETAAERRARAKAAKERDKRELDFQRREMERLQRKLDELSHTQSVTQIADFDNRISTELQTVEQMNRVKAAAITAKNGADAVAAEQLANQAQQRAWQLEQNKQQVLQRAQQQKVVVPPYIDKAKEFMAAHPWYNGDDNTGDNLLVKQIDNEVAKTYIPTSDEYWKELARRVQKNLPHRFKDTTHEESNVDDTDETPAPTRRGPPTGGSSRTSNKAGPGQIRLSPERIQAMKEAGLWDDEKTRTKMAKRYAEYDRSQRA